MNQEIDKALKYDSLHEAEKITGESYKNSEATTWMGMALHLANSEKKRQLLSAAGDTHFSMKLPYFLELLQRAGFEQVCAVDFQKYEQPDTLFIFWHPVHAILVSFDSYGGKDRINSGGMIYNHVPNENQDSWCYSSRSSIKEKDGVKYFTGHHDIREGMLHSIEKLLANGQFLNPWIEPHGYHFGTHYGETDEIFKDREGEDWRAGVERRKVQLLERLGERLSSRPDVLKATGFDRWIAETKLTPSESGKEG